MKLRKVLILLSAVTMLNCFSVKAEAVQEYYGEEGTVLTIGNVTNISDISKVSFDNGKLNLLQSGTCDVQVEDGVWVKIHITAKIDNKKDLSTVGNSTQKELKEEVQEDSETVNEQSETQEQVDVAAESDETERSSEVEEFEVEEIADIENKEETETIREYEEVEVDTLQTEKDLLGNVAIVKDESELKTSKEVAYKGSKVDVSVNSGELVSLDTSDPNVARVSADGTIKVVGTGECIIYANTGKKVLKEKVVGVDAKIDEEDVTIGPGEDYQIEITGDLQGQKPKYKIISGKGSIDNNGLLTVDTGETVKVKVEICGKAFYKKVTSQTRHEQKWAEMQPYIQNCLGTPYVFGGDAPGAGLDCSGYVSYIMRSVGLMGGRTTAQGLYNMCTMVSDPKPGDIVFFTGTYNCSDYITHVGVYAGDGCMYHSGKPNQYTAITGYYAQHLVGYGTLIHE